MYGRRTKTDYLNKHYIINQRWLQQVHRMDINRLQKQALQNKQKWLQHVQILDTNRLPKQALQYFKKWLNNVQILDTNRLTKQAGQYKQKMAITCTENGHKQTTKTNTTI